jgi:predicted permease
MWLRLIGRLRSGVTAETAQARTVDLFRQLVTEEAGTGITPDTAAAIAKLSTDLVSFAGGFSNLRRRWEKPLLLLMAVVGLVLLIVCASAGNLLLARGASRQREMAMRLALGAGRRRLIRQLLTESLLLSVLGGALGLVVAPWTIRFLLGILSPRGAASLDPGLDGRVLLFTAGVAGLAMLLFGVVPAIQATRVEIDPTLRRHSGTVSGDRRGGRLRRALVIFQVAVSLCLLVGAGLFVRSLGNLRSQDMGFRVDGVVLLEIDPQGGGYPEARLPDLHRDLLDRISALPDVSAASLSLYGLLGRSRRMEGATADGYNAKPGEDTRVQVLFVTPRYFD